MDIKLYFLSGEILMSDYTCGWTTKSSHMQRGRRWFITNYINIIKQ